MKQLVKFTSILALSTFLSACGDINGVPDAAQAQERSGNLRVYAGPGAITSSDVTQIKYTVKACAGSGSDFEATAVVPLNKTMVLPGGIGQFENAPLDKNSAHLFADHFQVLDAGCYDVTAIPLNAEKKPSEKCSQAQTTGLNVLAGATTESMLIVQCQAPDPGALDTITVINHEPRITNITFKRLTDKHELVDGNKFACGFENIACVTASDPDHDPLSVHVHASINEDDSLCEVSQIEEGTMARDESCYRITCSTGGRVDLNAVVFDMLRDDAKKLISFEEYFKAKGDPKSSRSEISFMSYLGGKDDCEEPCEHKEKECPADDDNCEEDHAN